MIKGPMAPANQKHEILDPKVTYDDFNNFLKFLYTDKCEINAENAEALLHLCHMYDVTYLFEICVNELPKLIGKPTLFKFAEIGLLYENKCNMLIKCLNEVPTHKPLLKYVKEAQTIWCSSEFVLEFVKHCPRTEKFTENNVFKGVFGWAKGLCKTRSLEINSRNLREIFAPFEPFICFEKMDIKILTSTVYEYKLVPEKRLLKCYRDHIVGKEDGDRLTTTIKNWNPVQYKAQLYDEDAEDGW